MTMNKKEQAEFAAAKKAVFVARALNWTEPVECDVKVPKRGETRGYLFNTYNQSIMHALSNEVHHAVSYIDGAPPTKTSSQNPTEMYSTELLALRALRHAVECESAEKLAKIDMQISEERAKGAKP